MRPLVRVSTRARREGVTLPSSRTLAEECPVALTYAATTHAVMMATPADLEDFAIGFTLSEGIAARDEILSVEAVEVDGGVDLRIDIAAERLDRLAKRRRALAGPVGCGLCGVESIAEALRDAEPVDTPLRLSPQDIAAAAASLARLQPLNAESRAVHAAGFYRPATGIESVREDVGRHNALDKLAGALARQGRDGTGGAVVLTSRVSVEMVQKAAALRAPAILAVSAPTALAVRSAEAAGITLVAVVRGADFEVFTHPHRILPGEVADVA